MSSSGPIHIDFVVDSNSDQQFEIMGARYRPPARAHILTLICASTRSSMFLNALPGPYVGSSKNLGGGPKSKKVPRPVRKCCFILFLIRKFVLGTYLGRVWLGYFGFWGSNPPPRLPTRMYVSGLSCTTWTRPSY